MTRPASKTETPSASTSLARAIGRRCRGRTLVLGRSFPELDDRLDAQGLDATTCPVDDLSFSQGSFDTVVLIGALETREQRQATELLQRVWKRVGPGGKLLVCVPNERHLQDPDVRLSFTRRRLKELLKKTIDQPKILTDQPYRWLLMAVEADARMDRPAEERHRVVAGLCRGEVLELGCAAGHLCAAIAQSGLNVRGIDKNRAKIDKARRLFPELDFAQADILEYPTNRRYATVILAEVLEHVPEDVGDAMLAKAWELVAPGGRLVVGVPNEDCVRHANHVREFTESDLTTILEPFGEPTIVTDQPFRWLLMYVDR